jgi:hypothetical protein
MHVELSCFLLACLTFEPCRPQTPTALSKDIDTDQTCTVSGIVIRSQDSAPLKNATVQLANAFSAFACPYCPDKFLQEIASAVWLLPLIFAISGGALNKRWETLSSLLYQRNAFGRRQQDPCVEVFGIL